MRRQSVKQTGLHHQITLLVTPFSTASSSPRHPSLPRVPLCSPRSLQSSRLDFKLTGSNAAPSHQGHSHARSVRSTVPMGEHPLDDEVRRILSRQTTPRPFLRRPVPAHAPSSPEAPPRPPSAPPHPTPPSRPSPHSPLTSPLRAGQPDTAALCGSQWAPRGRQAAARGEGGRRSQEQCECDDVPVAKMRSEGAEGPKSKSAPLGPIRLNLKLLQCFKGAVFSSFFQIWPPR